MENPSVKCALLATMIAKHKWGTPIAEEAWEIDSRLKHYEGLDDHD